MAQPRILRLYLDKGLRDNALAGQHNFINLVVQTVHDAGYRVEFCPNSKVERQKAGARRGYALFHMEPPTHDRALTMRRVYQYPFWAIEPSAERWHWAVARARFAPNPAEAAEARRFYRFWRRRLFGDMPEGATRQGYVYVPLQGKLLQHRSFQTCAPIDMLRSVLRHDPARRVVATLHPREHYDPTERATLQALAAAHPRLTLDTGGMERHLAACDLVVTQNSSAAFSGFFFGKPAVLFARIDFHHIAANVSEMGVTEALDAGPHLTPDYAGYVHWFWQKMSINAGRAEAGAQIRDRLIRAGWPMT